MSFEASLAETHQRKLKFATEKDIEQGLQQGMEQGMEQGRAEGVEQGKEEAKLEIARKMISSGMPANKVVSILEISIENLNKIIN